MSASGNDGKLPKTDASPPRNKDKSWRRFVTWFSRRKPSQSVPTSNRAQSPESKEIVKLSSKPEAPQLTVSKTMEGDQRGLSNSASHWEETGLLRDQDRGKPILFPEVPSLVLEEVSSEVEEKPDQREKKTWDNFPIKLWAPAETLKTEVGVEARLSPLMFMTREEIELLFETDWSLPEGVMISESEMRTTLEACRQRINEMKMKRQPEKDHVRDRSLMMTKEAFQELIRDRKAEVMIEAEEKRLEDLTRIADMKSRTGINPLELLPKEMWMKILDKLKPADRANMRHVHDVFHDLLEPDLIRDTLFPLVLDYKIPLVQRYIAPYSWYLKKRDLKDLITLREVSKSLRDSVDNWIEDRLLHLMRNSERRELIPRDVLNSLELHPAKDFNALQGDIGGVPRRPERFFLRSIKIKYFHMHIQFSGARRVFQRFSGMQVSAFKDNVTEFLRHVGDQILHVEIDIAEVMCPDRGALKDLIRKWLLHLPNLKWLQLKDPHVVEWRLAPLMEPFPKFPELERFDFDSMTAHSVHICDALLRANNRVKYFTRALRSIRSYTCIHIFNDPLVSALPLEAVNLGDMQGSRANVCTLEQISSNNWNLKRITLWMGQKEETHTIDQIFIFLERFPTLQDCELHINHVTIGQEVNFLRLPNLQDFSLEIGPQVKTFVQGYFFFSLHFLLYCSKLSKLVWEDLRDPSISSQLIQNKEEEMRDSPLENMIDFIGREDLSASNLWDVFPHLRSVKVKFVESGGEMPLETVTREYRDRHLVSRRFR